MIDKSTLAIGAVAAAVGWFVIGDGGANSTINQASGTSVTAGRGGAGGYVI